MSSTFTTNRQTIANLAQLPLLSHVMASTLDEKEDEPPLQDIIKPSVKSLSNESATVSFVVIGDWGRRGEYNQCVVAKALETVVNSNTNYIISTGDNFYKHGVSSVDDIHFQRSFEQIYRGDSVSVTPWYLVLGNHDHEGNIKAQIDYTEISSRWNMPGRFYQARLSANLIGFFLDTTTLTLRPSKHLKITVKQMTWDAGVQLEWLRNALEEQAAESPQSRFIVFGHHPMYNATFAKRAGEQGVRELLEQVLKPYATRIVAYVSGHEHSLIHMQPYVNGGDSEDGEFDHFISGGGSKVSNYIDTLEGDRVDMKGRLPLSREHEPRIVFANNVNGFFEFTIDEENLSAKAYNASADVIHTYERRLPPLCVNDENR